LEKASFPEKMLLIGNFCLSYFQANNPISSTKYLRILLSTKVHRTLLSLTLIIKQFLVDLSTQLNLKIWSAFPNVGIDSLHEIISKSLLVSLTSPDIQIIFRTIRIFEK
jgi:hypothetical protein